MQIIKKQKNNATAAVMIGTALEYYDLSLYGFMAPILIKVFLPQVEQVNALILTFIMPVIAIIVRPLGAVFIGKIGDKYGRKAGLVISIAGMAVVTGLIGILPTYYHIGIFAPILFVILRSIQGFFMAGEYNGGAIFVLEHAPSEKNAGYLSGIYSMYTVIGIAVATIVCTCVAYLPQGYWRLPYIIGSIAGVFGLYIRNNIKESPKFLEYKQEEEMPLARISDKYGLILASIGVVGLFTALYTLPTVFMNSFLPMVTSYSVSTIMLINTCTTILYLFTFPLFGHLADKISFYKSMTIAAVIIFIASYMLVSMISHNTLLYIFIMKLCFALLTAWFGAPFHAWIQSLFHVRDRYTAISFSYAIGSQLAGLMVPFSLWYWKETKSFASIYLSLMFWAAISVISLYYVNYVYRKR